MKKNIIIFALIIINFIFILSAVCLIVFTPKKAGSARVSTMERYVSRFNPGHLSSGEAKAMADNDGAAVILDLQSEASYDERRVSGAVNVAFENLTVYAEKNLSDPNQLIICYCFCGDAGGTALAAYNALVRLGYLNVWYAEPGDEWAFEGTSAYAKGVVSGQAAEAIIKNNPGAVLLDVRNANEYADRHAEGAVLIPLSELESRLGELDRDAIIIVYCRSGIRSASAKKLLDANGFKNVYDMKGINNWPGAVAEGKR